MNGNFKRAQLLVKNDLNKDAVEIFIKNYLIRINPNIPKVVPLNNSINIAIELKSYDIDINQVVEIELLAAGLKIAGKTVQRRVIDKNNAYYYWNANFPMRGRHDILIIIKLVESKSVTEVGTFTYPIRVKSLVNYQDLSFLLAIISFLLAIFRIAIEISALYYSSGKAG